MNARVRQDRLGRSLSKASIVVFSRMKKTYQFDTFEAIAVHFESMAEHHHESAQDNVPTGRAQIFNEAANTWRSAADVIMSSTLKEKA